jgi:hypothetical protein
VGPTEANRNDGAVDDGNVNLSDEPGTEPHAFGAWTLDRRQVYPSERRRLGARRARE